MTKDERQSRVLVAALVTLVLVSVALTYYRSFVSRDYEIIRAESESEIPVND